MRAFRWLACALFVLATLAMAGADTDAPPPTSPEPDTEPGQLEVVQMTAVELDGRLPDGVEARTFQWKIVEGTGAQLFNDQGPTAVFVAPKVEIGVERFVVELTVTYADQLPSTRRLVIRVLSTAPDAAVEEGDPDDTEWLQEIYRKEREQEDQEQQQGSSSAAPRGGGNTTMSIGVRGGSGGWGGGVGFRWSMSYPISQPVDVPPPGQTRQPGEGQWETAHPVPYRELKSTFPPDIASRYEPEDYPLPDDAEADAAEETGVDQRDGKDSDE